MRKNYPVLLLAVIVCALSAALSAPAKEQWTKVESPNFTLYAACSPGDAREWARCFQEFQHYVSEVMRVSPTQLQPLTMVLFRNPEAMRAFLPKRNGKTPTDLASVTMKLPTGTVIMTSLNWDDDATRQSFYASGTYWFLGGFKNPGPEWFQTGLSETFKTFTILNDEIRIGEPPDGSVQFLRENGLMPLPQLLGTSTKDLAFRGDRRTSRFYTESWALVHYLIYGRGGVKGGGKSPQLADFIEALNNGVPTDSAFQSVFGTNYAQMEKRLESYLQDGRYGIFTAKLDRAAARDQLTTTVLGEAGTELARGFAGLAVGATLDARAHFFAARELPGGELAAVEALGEMAMIDRNRSEASGYYSRALELGTRDYRAAYFFAEELVSGQETSRELPRFEAKRARVAANRYEQAINLYPNYLPSYERLALLMPSLEVFSEADRRFLDLGVRIDPANPMIHAGLGIWEVRNQRVAKGKERLGSVLAAEGVKGWPRQMAQGVVDAETSGREIGAARELVAAGKTEEAAAKIQELLRTAKEPAERQELMKLRTEIGQVDLVLQAEQLASDKQWDAAATIAQTALDSHPGPEIAQRANGVLERAMARK